MNDKEIFERLNCHYMDALKIIPENNFIGIFLQGSQNYNLTTENSDVDSKVVLTPTWESLCFNTHPISTTHIRKNDEHIDLKDIRLMFTTFRKQNINFIEILFTKYKILNPKYADAWNMLINFNEEIARYNPKVALKAMKGMALEKYHALQHEYPNKVEILKQYGYDPKQLHHLVRLEEFAERYIQGEKYKNCLVSKKTEELIGIKMGKYSLTEAIELADETLNRLTQMVDKYLATAPDEINNQVDNILNIIQEDIMKISIIDELNINKNPN